jgi:site-specific recombinase XerD
VTQSEGYCAGCLFRVRFCTITDTKEQPSTQPELNQSITRWFRGNRPSPWVVVWTLDGQRKSKAFKTEVERDAFADSLDQKRRRFGARILAFDPREWERYLQFRETTNYAPLDQIEQLWGHRKALAETTVAEAMEKFLAVKEPRISLGAYRHYKANLGRFAAIFGKRNLAHVTAADLETWIQSLPYAPQTVHTHFRDIRTFFNWLKLQELLDSNPVNKLEPPKVPRETIHFLLPWQGKRLFEANKDQPVVGRLACEAFVGVRFSAAAQIRPEHINRDDKGLTLWSKNDGGTRYIEGFPSTVWDWIAITPPEGWELTPNAYLKAKSDAFVRAGIENDGNVLRHSFCTYHSMLGKDLHLTATIAQNSVSMLDRHYRGKATSAQAKEWFSIRP